AREPVGPATACSTTAGSGTADPARAGAVPSGVAATVTGAAAAARRTRRRADRARAATCVSLSRRYSTSASRPGPHISVISGLLVLVLTRTSFVLSRSPGHRTITHVLRAGGLRPRPLA